MSFAVPQMIRLLAKDRITTVTSHYVRLSCPVSDGV
jgi:hypothetical protein